MRIAILDSRKRLIGEAFITDGDPLPEGGFETDPGDLPLDGSYYWSAQLASFVPMGYGHGICPSRGPVPETMVLYGIIKALDGVVDLPAECTNWGTWYEKRRHIDQERATGMQLREKRRIANGERKP